NPPLPQNPLPFFGYPTLSDINYVSSDSTTAPAYYSPPISYGSLAGEDLLVNDVISFEIKLLIDSQDPGPAGPLADARTGLRTRATSQTPVYVDPYIDLFDSQV